MHSGPRQVQRQGIHGPQLASRLLVTRLGDVWSVHRSPAADVSAGNMKPGAKVVITVLGIPRTMTSHFAALEARRQPESRSAT
jgi:hypothetical protein